MAITGLKLSTDRSNYSRYEPEFNIITATATFAAAAGGETISFQLQRRARGGPAAAPKWMPLGSPVVSAAMTAGQTSVTAEFDLTMLFDSTNFYIGRHSIRRNDWQIVATSSDATPAVASANFSVLLITVDRMKRTFLNGLPLIDIEKMQVREQPQLVTGVTVADVAFGTQPGAGVLAFVLSPESLSWNGGPAVPIAPGASAYTLPDAVGFGKIDVMVNFAALPVVSTNETLFIDYGQMPDSTIIDQIIIDTANIERFMWVPLEPALIVSEDVYKYSAQQNLVGPTPPPAPNIYDEIAEGVTYYKPFNVNQWLNIETPYPAILRIDSLQGWMNKTLVTTIDSAWIRPEIRGGRIQLVPSNAAIINWYLYGPGLYTIFFNYTSVPSFWHFTMLIGLPETPDSVIDYLGKRAGIVLLTQAMQARWPAGLASYSIARDGVSESRALMARLAQAIEEYERQIGRDPATGKDALLYSLRENIVGMMSVNL